MPHKFQMPKPYVDRLVQRQGRGSSRPSLSE